MQIKKVINTDKKFLAKLNRINQMVKYICPEYILMDNGDIIDSRVDERFISLNYVNNELGNIFHEIGIDGNIKLNGVEVFHIIRDLKKYFDGFMIDNENNLYVKTETGSIIFGKIVDSSLVKDRLSQVNHYNRLMNESDDNDRVLDEREINTLNGGLPLYIHYKDSSIVISKKILAGWKPEYPIEVKSCDIDLDTSDGEEYFLTRLIIKRKDGITSRHFILGLKY